MCKPCYLTTKFANAHTVNIHHTSDPINTKEKSAITKPKADGPLNLSTEHLQTTRKLHSESFIRCKLHSCWDMLWHKVILEYKTASANVKH